MGGNILLSVLEHVRRRTAERPLVIFDLDSTLFSTRHRSYQILLEAGRLHPALAEAVAKLRPDELGWWFHEDVREAGVADENLLDQLLAFWQERFFTNEYLAYDQPMPGAVDYVRRVFDAGATICYLTGRDYPNMKEGTVAGLLRHQFPYEDTRVALIMKEKFETPDEEHKRNAVECIRGLGEVVAAFDNEPELVNLMADSFPEAVIVWFHSIHSPTDIVPYPSVKRIASFEMDGT